MAQRVQWLNESNGSLSRTDHKDSELMDLLEIEWTDVTKCEWTFKHPSVQPLSEQETSQMLRKLAAENTTISWLGDSVFRRNAMTLRDWLMISRDPNATRKCAGPTHESCVFGHHTFQWDIEDDIHFRSMWTPKLADVQATLPQIHQHLGQQNKSVDHIIIVGSGVHNYASAPEDKVQEFVEEKISSIRAVVDSNQRDSFRLIFRTQAALFGAERTNKTKLWNRALVKAARRHSFPVFDSFHWSTGPQESYGRHQCVPRADTDVHLQEKARQIMLQQILNAVRILYMTP